MIYFEYKYDRVNLLSCMLGLNFPKLRIFSLILVVAIETADARLEKFLMRKEIREIALYISGLVP